jgi:hypothetical protein
MRFWQRHELDERRDAAVREAELSRERLDDAHREVVGPLRDFEAKNSFAEIIRATVVRGYKAVDRGGAP